jgi:uncharacterized protein with HEPN domain
MTDDQVRLSHMVNMAETLGRLTSGRALNDIASDEQLALAVVRALEIFGEAAARTSQALRNATPEIPWRQIIGTRNRLAHGYFDIDEALVWTAATRDVPALLPILRGLLAA